MKRLGRILYSLLTALSLLLLLATVVVWARSYWVDDTLEWYDWPQDRSFFDVKSIWCSRGGMQFEAYRHLYRMLSPPDDRHFLHDRQPARKYPVGSDDFSHDFIPLPHRYTALGFEWIPQITTRWLSAPDRPVRIQSLTLPLYFPCLLFALLPAHYLLRLRRRRRIARRLARGLCPSCGYDLRATPGRCPECGREAAAVAVSS